MNAIRHLTPTAANQRVVLLDDLRGLALFGIMFVNMTWFTGYAVLSPEQRIELGTASIDGIVYWLINCFIDGKFWALFALLFGIGAGIQLSRVEARGEKFMPMFLRRLSALVVIGLLHAVLLWFGDIVSLYAVVGFALLFFVRVSDRNILICAIALAFAPIVQSAIWQIANPEFDTRHGPYERLGDFGNGSYAEVLATNWLFLVKRWGLAIYSGRFLTLLSLFLLGFWAARKGVFICPSKHRRMLVHVFVWGLIIGLPINAILATVPAPTTTWENWLVGSGKAIGGPGLCLAYVAGFTLLHRDVVRDVGNEQAVARNTNQGMQLFTYAGRMALTNYILQSVIGVVLFYGYGFGFWGQIGMAWTLLLIIGIFVAQSLFSRLWLRFFRQGPLEWVWRCMTYGRVLPLRLN